MLTENDFRGIVLGHKETIESEHMGHPDFRANGRIFATLHGNGRYAMVKLTPEQQQELMAAHPHIFSPEAGAWGRGGSTRVDLEASDLDAVGEAVTLAWRGIMSKPPTRGAAAAIKPARTGRPTTAAPAAKTPKRRAPGRRRA